MVSKIVIIANLAVVEQIVHARNKSEVRDDENVEMKVRME
jgi:hypothetical protein